MSAQGEGVKQGGKEIWDAPQIQCKNVLKIHRQKMNHHKYRKLVKRTRFLWRKVREGRLKRKQMRFERDLRCIWQKVGLKEAPAGWQTPKIYRKGKSVLCVSPPALLLLMTHCNKYSENLAKKKKKKGHIKYSMD